MANDGEPDPTHPNVVPTWLKDLWRDHTVVMLTAGAVLALVPIVALIWPITDLIAAHDVGLTTGSTRAATLQAAREAVRTQLLTLSAGVFAAGALIFTAQNFRLSRHTFELTEQGQVTDRYTKAIEQLGSDKLDVRIGGIYALERVARDSARDHPTVIEVLAAFIREHSQEPWPPQANDEPGALPPRRKTRPDVAAALTVIRRRDATCDRPPIDLIGAVLSGAQLSGAQLSGAHLTGADFSHAHLVGANLSGADLVGASFVHADLSHANLTRAILSRTNLSGAHFFDADLTGAVRLTDDAIPEGWQRDTDTDGGIRLKRADTSAQSTQPS